MSTEVKNKGTFSITRKIAELLNLGDSGKIDSFLTRAVKTLNNEVKALNKNLDIIKFNYEQRLDFLKDQLEDVEVALQAEYLNIPVAKVETNALQTDYVDEYLNNLDRKSLAVTRIKDDIREAKEAYEEEVKDINDQIESLNLRIKNISKK